MLVWGIAQQRPAGCWCRAFGNLLSPLFVVSILWSIVSCDTRTVTAASGFDTCMFESWARVPSAQTQTISSSPWIILLLTKGNAEHAGNPHKRRTCMPEYMSSAPGNRKSSQWHPLNVISTRELYLLFTHIAQHWWIVIHPLVCWGHLCYVSLCLIVPTITLLLNDLDRLCCFLFGMWHLNATLQPRLVPCWPTLKVLVCFFCLCRKALWRLQLWGMQRLLQEDRP